METTYQAKIERTLSRIGLNGTENPDHSNTGSYLGDYFLWHRISKYADQKLKEAEDKLMSSGLITDPSTLDPGQHVLLESERFVLTANITKPAKRFNKDALIDILGTSKYKIPRALAVDFIEQANTPGKSIVRKAIAER